MASRHRGDFTRGWYSASQSVNKTVKKLREMGEHVLTAAKGTLKDGVDELVEDIKHQVPRRTGKLQESIKAISNKNGAEYVIQANAPALNKRRIPYGQFVEFDPKIGGDPIEGRFLYPAMRKHKPLIQDKIIDVVRKACGG